MQIERNKVVTFNYSLSEPTGQYTETTEGRPPAVYLHGYGGIVRGLERAMRGRTAGEAFSVSVAPEDAFGIRNEEAVQRIPVKHLIRPGKLQLGKIVAVNSKQGQMQGLVIKIGRFNVDVDFNHPLAGSTLYFDVEIISVRDATSDEIKHRHAHGPGGVNHADAELASASADPAAANPSTPA